MRAKTLTTILVSLIVGVVITLAAISYFGVPWRFFMHNGGFGGGMRTERQLSSDAFNLNVTAPSQTPRAGEELLLTAKITSKIAPHARTKISFWVDDKKVNEFEGVVPPYQAATVEFVWQAEAGPHKFEVILASAVGIELTRWEGTLEVASQ